MSNPLISIVIPVFNKELWITESLRSVFNQSYLNWECVIVNDGSTDESLKKITSFVEKHPANWRVLTIENSGQTFARNYGIQVSKGEYVSFLDADDLWHPNKLKAQIESFMSDPKLELVFTPYVIFSENQSKGFRVVKNTDPESLVSGWLTMRGFGGLIESTGMIKKSTLIDVDCFSPALSMSSGLDLSLRVVRSRKSLVTPLPMVFYRLSDGQFHKNLDALVCDLEVVRLAHSFTPESLKKLTGFHNNYLYWANVRTLGKSHFLKGVLSAFLLLDISKLTTLYFLVTRNLVALLRGFYRRSEIQALIQTHGARP